MYFLNNPHFSQSYLTSHFHVLFFSSNNPLSPVCAADIFISGYSLEHGSVYREPHQYRKLTLQFFRSLQLSSAPQLGMGTHEPLPILC